MNKDIKICKDWLEKDKENAIIIRGWCVKSVEELLSDKDNLHMENSTEGDVWSSRSNSIKKEIEEFRGEYELTNLDGDHDTSYEDDIKCPYCGYEHSDSWDFDVTDKEEEIECHQCEKDFVVSAEYSVTYTSSKKEKK